MVKRNSATSSRSAANKPAARSKTSPAKKAPANKWGFENEEKRTKQPSQCAPACWGREYKDQDFRDSCTKSQKNLSPWGRLEEDRWNCR